MAEMITKTNADKTEVLVNRVFADSSVKTEKDILANEEPLEIRMGYFEGGKSKHKAISITMRTPGNDFELAAGFLFTEGIIKSSGEIKDIKYCGKFNQPRNTVRVDLVPDTKIDFKKLERHFYTTSSCGVCGKSSIEALNTGANPTKNAEFPKVKISSIQTMPDKLRDSQSTFDKTGGLHAAGLFDLNGNLLGIKEDVGRHNAVDKLIGAELLNNNLPLNDKILFLSGRASFELVQKAVMAQIPVIAAVSAPSSLAVEAAREFNISLLGFVRDKKFNVYTGSERIINET
jgi:FdhD protein